MDTSSNFSFIFPCTDTDWYTSPDGGFTWRKSAAPWAISASEPATTLFNGSICAAGGIDERNEFTSRYDCLGLGSTSAPWLPRTGAAIVGIEDVSYTQYNRDPPNTGGFAVFGTPNNKAYLLGGTSYTGMHNMSPVSMYSSRTCAHMNPMITFIIGTLNDVWVLFGVAQTFWSRITDAALWSARYGHTVTVVSKSESAILLGGFDKNTTPLDDVWWLDLKQVKMVTARKLTQSGGFPARGQHQAWMFLETLYVMAGSGLSSKLNDVWASADYGHSWIALGNAEFLPRSGFTLILQGRQVMVLNGQGTNSMLNDVWVGYF